MRFIKLICALILFSLAMKVYATEETVFTENKTAFLITASHPQFVIKLKSNPTTGYSWYLTKYFSNMIEPVSHHFQPGDKHLIGAPGYEMWTFKLKPAAFKVPQQTKLSFVYVRPWEKEKNVKPLVFYITSSQ